MSRLREARIVERGNGLPDVGDLVAGDDGELYSIVAMTSRIHTAPSGSGGGNYVLAHVGLADWGDVADDGEVHTARAVLGSELVLIEEMPDHLRDAHREARNWGDYPHNGATRRLVPRSEAEEVIASDRDGYAHEVSE